MSDNNKPINVLLVEDLDDDRFLFQHAFGRAGANAKLVIANDGIEATDYFQNKGRFADPLQFPRPDIVFLDLKMPHRNGFEVLQWLRDAALLDAVKVIVLTGSHEPADMERCCKLGALDYIVKPIDAARLKELLQL